ncbi:histone deacetylase family protein [Neisseriaceae bacterium CLB008]
MNVFYHPEQMKHQPLNYYSRGKMRTPQEKPERMSEFLKAIDSLALTLTEPQDFGIDPITAVHDLGFVHFLRTAYQEWHDLPEDWGEEVQSNIFVRENNPLIGILAKAGRYLADGSAPIGKHTWTSAYWAAQTALGAAQSLLDGAPMAVALTRPAGHHARKDGAGGFCYLNNAAIAAQFMRATHQKVAIIDTDMHHGQGVQEIFYDRSDVLYTSVHGSPVNFYPAVAGFENERGRGAGEGYNLNFPMPHGIDEAGFFQHVDQAIEAVHTFNPDVVVHILGFDVYVDDPQSKSAVSTEGFRRLAQKIAAINKPTMVLVEGGYLVEKLADNLTAFMQGLES